MDIRAYAKINLALDVVRKREDGYHDLRMVMQMTGMYDLLRIEPKREPGVTLTSNLPFLPTDSRNLAVRAASLLMETCGVTDGLSIRLHKFIPVAAGLAGGSSDAAAVLVGTNRALRLGLPKEKLLKLGLSIGADVPYCLLGGTALAEGVGEILTPLPHLPNCSILLAKPPFGVSTKEIFQALRADEIETHPDVDGMVAAIREGDLPGILSRSANVLESVTIPKRPGIRQLKDFMTNAGAEAVLMSGSGPTVFGIFTDQQKALVCRDSLRTSHPEVHSFLTVPVRDGAFSLAEAFPPM